MSGWGWTFADLGSDCHSGQGARGVCEKVALEGDKNGRNVYLEADGLAAEGGGLGKTWPKISVFCARMRGDESQFHWRLPTVVAVGGFGIGRLGSWIPRSHPPRRTRPGVAGEGRWASGLGGLEGCGIERRNGVIITNLELGRCAFLPFLEKPSEGWGTRPALSLRPARQTSIGMATSGPSSKA